MAQYSMPWQGRVSLGAPGDAGPYSSVVWRRMMRNTSTNGDKNNFGVFKSILGELAVVAQAVPNNTVTMRPGTALVAGGFYINDADLPITVPANGSGNPRIDLIVLRYDAAAQTIRQAYLTGSPAAFPVAPTLTQNILGFFEIPIAYITVAAGFVTIAQSVIFSARMPLNVPPQLGFPFIPVSPSGGGEGAIYGNSPSAADIYSLLAMDPGGANKAVGVSVSRFDDFSLPYPMIVPHGLVPVLVNAAITVGQYLKITPAGVVGAQTPEDAFGVAYTAASGGGQKVLAFVNFLSKNLPPHVQLLEVQASGVNGGNFANGAWRTRVLNSEGIDTNGLCTLAANQFTLVAGVYEIRASAPAWQVDGHSIRLQNITAGTTLILGSSEYSPAAGSQNRSILEGRFTLAVSSALEIQHQCQTTNATGFGRAASIAGKSEIYTLVEIHRITSLD